MRLLTLSSLVAALAVLAAGAQVAHACSCALPDARSALAAGDGAFVGTLVQRRESDDGAVLTFDVERSLEGGIGRTVEVRTPSNSAACGIEAPVGTRVGLVLDRRDGAWHGHLCLQFSPADLLAAVRPLPPPNGNGPVALLVAGRFGTARLLALDARGRTLAYGHGGGTGSGLSVCPGNRRAVEQVHTATGVTVAVRELRTLRFVRRQQLRLDPRLVLHELRCVDAAGRRLLAFLSGVEPEDPDRARVVRIGPSGVTVVWRGSAYEASLTDRTAYVTRYHPARPTLVAVDAVTGRARTLARLPAGTGKLVPDRSGTTFAGTAYDPRSSDPARLLLVDTRAGRIRSVLLGTEVSPDGVLWLRDGRLAHASYSQVRTFDERLRVVARIRPWQSPATALSGASVVGIRGASLVEARLPDGAVHVVRRLPGATGRLIVSVR